MKKKIKYLSIEFAWITTITRHNDYVGKHKFREIDRERGREREKRLDSIIKNNSNRLTFKLNETKRERSVYCRSFLIAIKFMSYLPMSFPIMWHNWKD